MNAGLMLELPVTIEQAMSPLLVALPFSEAMPGLCPPRPASDSILQVARQVAADPVIAVRPRLLAGLWLYVDDLDRSHRVSQDLTDPTGSMWHAIMHRREGDFSNSHYWLRRAGGHPALACLANYDPQSFVSQVEVRYQNNPTELVEMQRREWAALFEWCAREGE